MKNKNLQKLLTAACGMLVGALIVYYFASVGFDNEKTVKAAPVAAPKVLMVDAVPKAFAVFEARAAEEIEPPVSVVDLPDAANGVCCYIGPEKVNEKPETKQYKKGFPEAANPGYARIKFTVPETAAYAVWVRVRWSDDCGDSLDVALDGKFFGTVQGNAGKSAPRWQWLRVGGSQPLSRRLEAGSEHTLELCNREDDLWFDQVVLVDSEADYTPSGIVAH